MLGEELIPKLHTTVCIIQTVEQDAYILKKRHVSVTFNSDLQLFLIFLAQ